jgi:hypothetical protein
MALNVKNSLACSELFVKKISTSKHYTHLGFNTATAATAAAAAAAVTVDRPYNTR